MFKKVLLRWYLTPSCHTKHDKAWTSWTMPENPWWNGDVTIWLWLQFAMENHHAINGKIIYFYGPSKNHGYVSHNQRVIGKSTIHGGCSFAMFDYGKVIRPVRNCECLQHAKWRYWKASQSIIWASVIHKPDEIGILLWWFFPNHHTNSEI